MSVQLIKLFNLTYLSLLNGISHSCQLDQSVSILSVVGWYFLYLIEQSVGKSWRPLSDATFCGV